MSDYLTLAIETSCDETAAAVVKNGRQVLSNVIDSQIDIHTRYGGVVPEIASRNHIANIDRVIRKALSDAGVTLDDIDGIGVTKGPGLVGALLVGVAEAKALAFALNTPLIGINHIEGHVCANFIEHPRLEPPFLCLIVSGGHTHLAMMKDYGSFDIIGRTVDDAAGEAFDKVARAIGLGYPGGPKIEEAAKKGDPDAIRFPRGKVDGSEWDFSFSGMKSAVLNYLNQENMAKRDISVPDVAASFQQAVTDVLTEHAIRAAKAFCQDRLVLAGGVAANRNLTGTLLRACEQNGIELFAPSPVYCTDNAAMIGAAAYHHLIRGERDKMDLNAEPALKL